MQYVLDGAPKINEWNAARARPKLAIGGTHHLSLLLFFQHPVLADDGLGCIPKSQERTCLKAQFVVGGGRGEHPAIGKNIECCGSGLGQRESRRWVQNWLPGNLSPSSKFFRPAVSILLRKSPVQSCARRTG